MNQAWMFLVFLTIASDMLAAVVSGWMLWRRRNGGIALFAMVFFGIFCRGAGELIANAFGYERAPVATIGFAWSYWLGRAAQTITIWTFTLYILGVSRKDKKDGGSDERQTPA